MTGFVGEFGSELSTRKIITPVANHYRKILKHLPVVQAIAGMSKDPSTKVGAIAIGKHYSIVSEGLNGFPRGANDLVNERFERPLKYEWTVHAEANLICNAAREGHSLDGTTVLITGLPPCTECSKLLIQAGVHEIITTHHPNERWAASCERAAEILKECRVQLLYTDELTSLYK